MFSDAHATKTRRKLHLRLLLLAAVALVLTIKALYSEAWIESLASRPDLYAILFDELARQHYLASTTTTIVKERNNTLEIFQKQYTLRNQKLNLPQLPASAPNEALAYFSYVPGGPGLTEVPLEQLLWLRTNPTMQFTEPSGRPVAVWFYSRTQRLLAVFCYEMLSQEQLNNPPVVPDRRVIEDIHLLGADTEHGGLPWGKAVVVHAYLLPFGDLKLDNLERHSNENPDLSVFTYALPLLFPLDYAGFKIPPDVTNSETIARLRAEAARPFLGTRDTLRGLAVLCGGWILFELMYLPSLRRRYHRWVESRLPETQKGRSGRLTFMEFLSGDLESIASDEIARAVGCHNIALAERYQQQETHRLVRELQSLRDSLELTQTQKDQIDRALSEGSFDALRKLVAMHRSLINERNAYLETQAQQERDRQREIRRLELELETIPDEKRGNDARLTWGLYQRARATEDEREKLHLLKEARKKLPRDLRPDRF